MSVVITLPELLMAAVGRLQAIGSGVSTANVTAALPITGVIPAAADEVSMVTAASFAAYGQLYQAISAEAQLIHEQFVKALGFSANSYTAAEAANATHAGGGSTSGVPMQPVPVGPSPSSPAPAMPAPSSPAPRMAPSPAPTRPSPTSPAPRQAPDRMPAHPTPAEPASTTPYREGYGACGGYDRHSTTHGGGYGSYGGGYGGYGGYDRHSAPYGHGSYWTGHGVLAHHLVKISALAA
ncbi:Triacylglycerol lipase [Mycobacterium pseudokansasii]|nr:Triacylglycerol lipase [Mycobacterium pseudokansasii]